MYKSVEVPDGVDAQGNAQTKWIFEGDTNKNNVEEMGEDWKTVAQNSSTSVVNTYAIIAGQAVVMKSVTTTMALDDKEKVISKGQHGYSLSVVTVQYEFNEKGQMTGALGSGTTEQNQLVQTLVAPGVLH